MVLVPMAWVLLCSLLIKTYDMRLVLAGLLLSPFVFLGLGHLGWLHPMFDSFAVFRQIFFWCALIAALGLFTAHRWKWAFLGSIYLALIAMSLWPVNMNKPDISSEAWHVYQKNLLYRSRDKALIIKDIIEANAEFVTIQEVSKYNRIVLERLKPVYKSQQYCRFATVGGTAVLSTFPMIENTGGCVDTYGAAYMRVKTPAGPVWAISIHLHWPWPFGQQEQIDTLIPVLAKLEGAKIISGDFNMVPWTHRFADFERKLGVQRINGIQRSFNLKDIFHIPIDHVFYSWEDTSNSAITRPLLGSDHLGVLANIPTL